LAKLEVIAIPTVDTLVAVLTFKSTVAVDTTKAVNGSVRVKNILTVTHSSRHITILGVDAKTVVITINTIKNCVTKEGDLLD